MKALFKISSVEPGGMKVLPKLENSYTNGGLSDNKLARNAAVIPTLITRIPDAIPYESTTTFLFDLNHEKNRWQSSPVIAMANI